MRTILIRGKLAMLFMVCALVGYGLGLVPAAARPSCSGLRATKVGTAGNDVLRGTRRVDSLVGMKGNDRLFGLEANDKICGGLGNDVLDGGIGVDVLLGEAGRDTALGAGGPDTIKGGGGSDNLKGAGGKDKITGGGGNDTLRGGGGNDVLVGGTGTDVIDGGSGTDNCSGGETYISCEQTPPTDFISIGDPSTLEVPVANMAPGDQAQRTVDIQNLGFTAFTSLTVTTQPAVSSVLDTDSADGLQLTVDRCSVAWTESGPPLVYSCSGTQTSVVATRSIIGSSLALGASPALASGQTDHLLVTLRLPSSAGNAFQSAASQITFTFVAS